MPSSKLSNRRGTAVRPHVCHPPPPPIPPFPPPPCTCFFSPNEIFGTVDQTYQFNLYGCCLAQGEVEATALYTCTGGEWFSEEEPIDNCGALAPNDWTAPSDPGNYILTATITWPNAEQCITTAITHIESEH